MLDRRPRRSVSKWKPCWRGLGQHRRSSIQICGVLNGIRIRKADTGIDRFDHRRPCISLSAIDDCLDRNRRLALHCR